MSNSIGITLILCAQNSVTIDLLESHEFVCLLVCFGCVFVCLVVF